MEIDERNAHVMFIPFPAQSHVKAALKLATLINQRGIHVSFLNTTSIHKRLLKSGGPDSLDGTATFRFLTIPDSTDPDVTPNLLQLHDFLLQNFSTLFLEFVATLEKLPTCIIVDGHLTYANAVEAVEQLKLPIMLYWPIPTSGLMGIHIIPRLIEKSLIPLKDVNCLTNGYLDTVLDWVPGMKEIRLKDLPNYVRVTDSNDGVFLYYKATAEGVHKVSRMIVDTFEELEAGPIKVFKSMFSNVYTIGPLQLLLNQTTKDKETNKTNYSLWQEEPKCIEWLQSKKPRSVVYVNFGSLTVMSQQELLDLGWGLIDSGHYFLWIIRPDMVAEGSVVWPQEFEERGFIAGWCSQEEVLNHPSIGGFLTHGGWASVFESLSAGVPMICWPHTSDQWMSCRQMCVEWHVGMEFGSNVKRDRVKKLVRDLMEGEEGKQMRKKAIEWKEMAKTATTPNGSSYLSLDKLVDDIIMLSKK